MADEEKVEAKEEKEEKVESVDKALINVLASLTEQNKTSSESIVKGISVLTEKVESLTKAMETPQNDSNQPAPAGSKGEDVGAKETVKKQPYPSEMSEQASIDDASNESSESNDKTGLKMEEKAEEVTKHTIETTPRPGATAESLQQVEKSGGIPGEVGSTYLNKSTVDITKSYGKAPNRVFEEIMKQMQENPDEAMGIVATKIRKGEFGGPVAGDFTSELSDELGTVPQGVAKAW